MVRFWAPLVGVVLLTGCPRPGDDSSANSPLVREAMNLRETDPSRAARLLERALEGNPRLARAHLALGVIHYEKTHDYAAAIYHFQKYLKLEPDSAWKDDLDRRIQQCKVDLARTGLNDLTDLGAQRRIQTLNRRIQSLEARNEQLTREKNALTRQVNELTARLREQTAGPGTARAPARHAATRPRAGTPSGALRHYTVRKKDTLSKIARAHGVSLQAMVQANPNINPDKLKVGQVINLPAAPPR